MPTGVLIFLHRPVISVISALSGLFGLFGLSGLFGLFGFKRILILWIGIEWPCATGNEVLPGIELTLRLPGINAGACSGLTGMV